MKQLSFCLISFLMVLLTLQAVAADKTCRYKYNFNSDWQLMIGDPEGASQYVYNDSGWKKITLPYAWNQDEAFMKDIADLSTGIAWYRKHFVLPETIGKESKVFIEFEGVRQSGEVYVNGTFIGMHENGVMAFGFDISNLIKPYPQENIIAVRTNNDWDYQQKFYNQKYQWSDRNFNANYGGIPKNVYLHICEKVYQTLPLFSTLGTTGVYVYATDFNVPEKSAVVHVCSEVKNETQKAVTAKMNVIVDDLSGNEVARFEGTPQIVAANGTIMLNASQAIENLEFWSWGYGYLYNVHSQLAVDGEIVDDVSVRTGFRKTSYKDGMVYLNDRVIQLKGYAQRTSNEWPAVGMSVPPWLSDYSNKLMTESNGNFVRWMHVTPWKQDVESCDRVGLIEAMPAGDAESDVSDHRWEQRKELMRDAIIYNRNNPSILFYEGGNENISEEHIAELKAIRDQYDPYGGRAIGSREMLDSRVAEYGGEMLYINKSAGKPLFAMEYSRDEGLRKYWDEYTFPFHKDGDGPLYKGNNASEYNRNQDSHAIEDIIRWYDYYCERPGTGKRVSSGGANIIFSDTNTHHRGAENYRRSGETDAMRIPKDNFWAHKVMWAGWVDLEDTLTHIIGHWNYSKGTVKNVYVVSGAEKVELLVNGKSKGFGAQTSRFLYTFKDIAYEAGKIEAIGYNSDDEKVSEDVITTSGQPYAIKLTLHESTAGFKADGADMVFADFEVVDKKGQRCPVAFDTIEFELNGPAEWLGGIAQGENNFIHSNLLPVECGVNRVLLRSATEAGKISLKAKARGLKSAEIHFESQPFNANNGLALLLPADGLPVNLDKGPTPQNPSYKVSRIAVLPESVAAGANSDKAIFCYDDNEMTAWDNGGNIETGWITFKLERKAAISEVNLKLSGWRTRSYPINIKVGDSIVFSGETPRSLGYVLFKFASVVGDEVTIELMGASSYNDTYNLVEVTGKKDNTTVNDFEESKAGSLKIVEAEFYETVNPVK